jgi:hypothetical protein
MSEETTDTPTLQSLTGRKILALLAESNTFASNFSEYEPGQICVFLRLLKPELKRLLDDESLLDKLQDVMPVVDFELFANHPNRSLDFDWTASPNSPDMPSSPILNILEDMGKTWKYVRRNQGKQSITLKKYTGLTED